MPYFFCFDSAFHAASFIFAIDYFLLHIITFAIRSFHFAATFSIIFDFYYCTLRHYFSFRVLFSSSFRFDISF
jgi:hypothetical protein